MNIKICRPLLNVLAAGKTVKSELKPLAAIKAMIRNNCYNCLCHPVCCKYLKAKWMEFGWKIYSASLLIYIVFLVSLNVYAFSIPTYQESLGKKGRVTFSDPTLQN